MAVDDVLDDGQPEARSALVPALHDIDPVEPLGQARQVLGRDAGAVILHGERDLGHRPLGAGDRDELIRVFENLVENALKYGASGKRVEIRLETVAGQGTGGGEAKISVRDYGPGIAPEHLPRLTERFYRVDVGLSRAEGGTGLGLALVKHIVNRHRGHLDIASEPGQGARFTVRFPEAGPRP